MKRSALLIPLIGLAVLFQSCVPDPITCIRVSSSTITETRDIKDFKGIVGYDKANIIITQGNDYVVRLTGPENVVELTGTTLVDDYLTVHSNDCFNGAYDLTIEVTAPAFELIYLSGEGTIETTDTLRGQNIQVELLGSIDADIALEMDSVFTIVQGDGSMNLSGLADYHGLDIYGEYALNAFPFITAHTAISLIGLAECKVTANETLDVTIEGSGKVYYKGAPVIDSNISGDGEIIDSN